MKDLRRTVFHGVAALRGAYFNQTSIRSGRIASVTDPVRRGRVAWVACPAMRVGPVPSHGRGARAVCPGATRAGAPRPADLAR